MSYDRESYWSAVGQHIEDRTARRDVAGDENAFYRYKRRKMLAKFLGALPVDGRTVMELGSGPGGNLEWLARNRKPAQLIGVDISSTMLRLASERLGRLATLLKTDGEKIPLPDASVDLAYTVTVLQHNTTPEQLDSAVRELARVTRGSIVLMEDTALTVKSTVDSWIARTRGQYEAALAKVGYRLESTDFLGLRVSREGYARIRWHLGGVPEGAPAPRLMKAVVGAWVAIAAPLDSIIRDNADLTRMVFVR